MADSHESRNEGPLLVDTGKGLSVSWKGRFLYSSRDPAALPVRTALQATIRPETLVLCPSPLLGYGMRELLDAMPASCSILALEESEELMSVTASMLPASIKDNPRFRCFRLDSPAQALHIIEAIQGFPFRRCLRLDLSGGAALNPNFYREAHAVIDEHLSRWWKNRFTLMRLGRGYGRNIFRNMPALLRSRSLQDLFPDAMKKPICVCGAGPSLDRLLPELLANRADLFILAVDAAVPSLIYSGLKPDLILVLESQFWIEESLYAAARSGIPVLGDLTARPGALSIPSGPAAFCLTEYADMAFLKRLKQEFPLLPRFMPLGSVGLTALQAARSLAHPNKPVLFCGLDFSWKAGYTHSREAPAPARERREQSRFRPLQGDPSELKTGVSRAAGKQGAAYTDPALSGYAQSAREMMKTGSFLDLGEEGLPLGVPGIRLGRAIAEWMDPSAEKEAGGATRTKQTGASSSRADSFLRAEKKTLEDLRGILTGESGETNDSTPEEQSLRVLEILRSCDYLWTHFPDGHRGPSLEKAFLNRVRVEIEYFLKSIDTALSEL